jgi:hypothetical protein
MSKGDEVESVIRDSSAVIALFNSADHHQGAIVVGAARTSNRQKRER